MGIIKRLDPIIANKIAAGEVIEKMANVVKELVENAIDANASHVDVELEQAGLSKIQVIDDGQGMDEDDIKKAFERHATSKIESVNDLFRIQSLGFRGEAIPSIASISKTTIISNPNDHAMRVVFDNGQFVEMTDARFNQGTKVVVEKIFHYTPARFKYIKSEPYELSMIQRLMYQFALSYPNISFQLSNNRKLILSSQGDGQVKNILASIYGTNVGKGLFSFEGENRDYHIHGLTTKPVINRSNNHYMHIIVNHRVIQDPKIIKAVMDAYEQMIPKQRYPITVLYIEVDPLLIDVNVHPRKQEIKFSEKQSLLKLIKETLSKTLQNKPIFQDVDVKGRQTAMDFSLEEPLEDTYDNDTHKSDDSIQEDALDEEKLVIPFMTYIGQYAGTYLLFQNDEGLFMVDQHAAAERIRYERYLKEMTTNNQAYQKSMFGLDMDYPADVISTVKEHKDVFETIGIDLDIQDSKLVVNEIPQWFPKGYEDMYIEAIVDNILEEKDQSKSDLVNELAILLACKHSLKANHYITKVEADHLMKDLRQCKRPYTCPHGRPIIVKIKHSQVEHWFNRVI